MIINWFARKNFKDFSLNDRTIPEYTGVKIVIREPQTTDFSDNKLNELIEAIKKLENQIYEIEKSFNEIKIILRGKS